MLIIAEKDHNRKQNNADEGDKERIDASYGKDQKGSISEAMIPSIPVIMRIPP